MKVREWNRLQWGVKQYSVDRLRRFREGPNLLGAGWDDIHRTAATYNGEPCRPLLFTTRAAARGWCRAKYAKYRDRTDCCADWRFVPVRVRETIRLEV